MAHTILQKNKATAALRKHGSRGIPWYEQEHYAADKGNHRKAVAKKQRATYARTLERKASEAYAKAKAERAEKRRHQVAILEAAKLETRRERNARYQARLSRLVGAFIKPANV